MIPPGDLGLYLETGVPEHDAVAARPPSFRLCGPLGGHVLADPARLRSEAARLLAAADLLEAEITRFDPTPGRLHFAEPS